MSLMPLERGRVQRLRAHRIVRIESAHDRVEQLPSFVRSSTQSSRRSTVNGRITLPYSDCL
jgi:hypothetical protein